MNNVQPQHKLEWQEPSLIDLSNMQSTASGPSYSTIERSIRVYGHITGSASGYFTIFRGPTT